MRKPNKLTGQREKAAYESPTELTTNLSNDMQDSLSTYPRKIPGCPSAVAADAMVSRTIEARKEREAAKILNDA